MTLLDQLIEATLKRCDLGTIPGKLRFVEMTAKHISRIADPREREMYIIQVATMAGLPADTIRRQAVAR